jgi:hypothetical protein
VFLSTLPPELEDGEALLKRRERAATRKEMWRSIYQDAQRFAMPARETFSWTSEGQNKNSELYDTTLQDLTYAAANTMLAVLFPPWTRWAEYAPGGAIPKKAITQEITEGLQDATEMFFGFLNSSNFATAIGETALDLLIGTGAITMDEGDNEAPFVFTPIPISAIELEEGPNGTVETKFMCREPTARNLQRLYPGMELMDLPMEIASKVMTQPDEKVKVIQCEVYFAKNKHYYGIVVDPTSKQIIWRYDYGFSCPTIVARATKVSGELYGRGRVMLALSDAKSLNKMQEYVLRHAALQVAPPMTGVSDGVMNPYTAVLAPATILPVASNDNGNPSLRVLEVGGNFQITEALMSDLREGMRKKLLGPARSEGAIKSATEISTEDRDRLWQMGGEFGRIQYELLAKIIARGAFILQKKGLMPKFEVNGRAVTIKYTSPFAKSQAQEDIQGLLRVLQLGQLLGPQAIQIGLKVEDMPEWVAHKEGLDEKLIRGVGEKKQLVDAATQAIQAAPEVAADAAAGAPQEQ